MGFFVLNSLRTFVSMISKIVKCLAVVIGIVAFAYLILQCANDNYEFENHSEIPKNNY